MADNEDKRDDATVAAFSRPQQRREGPVRGAPDRNAPGARFFGNDLRYQVTAVLGKGGFGTVYKAFDHRLAKYVAVKTINISDIPARERGDYLHQFDNEAKIAAQLEHPGVVTVLDYDPYNEEPYLVMPLVECGTLKDWFAQHPRMPWPQAIDLGIQMAEALAYAYRHGVHVHRDVKPANIFCAPDGRYKLGDFGIARRQRVGTAGITRSTFFSAGTPRYMAPEQITTPRNADQRADLFSLCVVLYEALTGKQPFRGVSLEFDPEENPTSANKIVDAAFDPPIPIRRFAADVPADLAKIIERGMAKDPKERFASCADFANALKRVDTSPGAATRQTVMRIASVVLVVVLIGIVVNYRNLLGRSLQTIFAGVVGAPTAATDLWKRVNVKEIDPALVLDAQREAIEADAEKLAPVPWEKGEVARKSADEFEAKDDDANANEARSRAIEQYSIASRQAWDAQSKDLTRKVDASRQRAVDAGLSANPKTSTVFEEADDKRRQATDVFRNKPADAVAALKIAFDKFEQILVENEEHTSGALVRRIDELKKDLRRIPELSDSPHELSDGIASVREKLTEIDRAVQKGELEQSRQELSQLENRLHDLVLDTTLEIRRRIERLRSESGAARGGTEDQKQRRTDAERTYSRAIERLRPARTSQDLFAVIELLQEAKVGFEGHRRGTAASAPAADGSAILAADSLRTEAEDARAPLYPRARAKYESGVRSLNEARQLQGSNPKKSTDLAKSAAISFAQAKASAQDESTTLTVEVPGKRAAAMKARLEAEQMGAATDERAGDAYRSAQRAMLTADSITDSSPAALAQRAAHYDEAVRLFDKARTAASGARVEAAPRIQDVPPPAPPPVDPPVRSPADAFQVQQEPSPAGEVLLQRDGASVFRAKTKVKGVEYAWYFNGKEITNVRDFPGIEFDAPSNVRDGVYPMQVKVTDPQGRQVIKEWSVRIVSE